MNRHLIIFISLFLSFSLIGCGGGSGGSGGVVNIMAPIIEEPTTPPVVIPTPTPTPPVVIPTPTPTPEPEKLVRYRVSRVLVDNCTTSEAVAAGIQQFADIGITVVPAGESERNVAWSALVNLSGMFVFPAEVKGGGAGLPWPTVLVDDGGNARTSSSLEPWPKGTYMVFKEEYYGKGSCRR